MARAPALAQTRVRGADHARPRMRTTPPAARSAAWPRPVPSAQTEEDPLPADVERADVDLASQLGNARVAFVRRRSGIGGQCSLRGRRLGEERGVGGQLLARRPRARAGDDEPRVVGEDDGLDASVLADAGELVVEGDERVVASQAASFLARRHARIVAHSLAGGQDSRVSLCTRKAAPATLTPHREHAAAMHEAESFARRRAAFFDGMASASPSAVAVIPAAPVFVRNNDVEHEYRQDSDFFYLTGFDEPESVAVLDGANRTFTLFVRPRDRDREVWDGPRTGVDGAKSVYGADEAFVVADLDDKLSAAFQNHRRV